MRRNERGNKQRKGSPCRLPVTQNYQYWQENDKRSTDRSTSITQWKFCFCGIESWRSPAHTPCPDNDRQGIYGTNRLSICATAQPRRLPTNSGNRPIASAWNRKVSTKPRKFIRYTAVDGALNNILPHGKNSLPVPIGGRVNRI